MLMMRRRAGETILIGGEIKIHIAQIGRSRVKVGIVAPRHLRVIAQEVEMVEAQNRFAAGRLPGLELTAALVARALEKRRQDPGNRADKSSEVDPGHPQPRKTRARQEAG